MRRRHFLTTAASGVILLPWLKPLGIRDYCMSCTLVTMMLDGLTKSHTLKLRDRKAIP